MPQGTAVSRRKIKLPAHIRRELAVSPVKRARASGVKLPENVSLGGRNFRGQKCPYGTELRGGVVVCKPRPVQVRVDTLVHKYVGNAPTGGSVGGSTNIYAAPKGALTVGKSVAGRILANPFVNFGLQVASVSAAGKAVKAGKALLTARKAYKAAKLARAASVGYRLLKKG
jgi:hypothetical protein